MPRRTLFLVTAAVLAIIATVVARTGSSPADAQGLNVTVSVSKPANGSFLLAGEKATVSVTLADNAGGALTRDSFATLNLYMYGPQETAKTITPDILNSNKDRTKTPHHYINLLDNPNVTVNGSTLRYGLQAVTSEEPGTYVAAVWASAKGEPALDKQMFALAEFQIGTTTIEKQIVEKEKCAACHLGASNGVFYFHHVDPGRSPFGSPSIDSIPPFTCKACHNNDGYAAYSGNVNDPTVDTATVRTPDPLVRRVHGVHRGTHLEATFNIDPEKGNFSNYLHVEFPADVRNCTLCHVDERFKTKPTQQACGACHDGVWFGDAASKPADRKLHSGGPQPNDANCAVCHPPDTGGIKAVAEAHKIPPPNRLHSIEIAMSGPKNGKFFVAGEAPQVGVTIKDLNGNVIAPNTIVEPVDAAKPKAGEFRRANLYVSGPRVEAKPVLTLGANTATSYANNDLRVLKDPAKADPRVTRNSTSTTYQLSDVKDLQPGTYTVLVETLPPAPNVGSFAVFNFQVGTATEEKKIATNCTDCHGTTVMHPTYFAVPFNTDICNSCHDTARQISGTTTWTDRNNGFGAAPLARRVHGVHFGRYLEKPKEVHSHDYSGVIFPQDVRNCTKCHDSKTAGANWNEEPSRVACLACHDSDLAIGHAQLQTIFPAGAEPYSPSNQETCKACHGANRDVSALKAHNISSPYKPPYEREPKVRGIKQ